MPLCICHIICAFGSGSLNAQDASHIIQQFRDMQNMDKVDVEYFEALFLYATEHTTEIDTEISSHMDRSLDQIDPIERSVLRICCTELMTRLDAPYKVVVNEALEISKNFGADKGYRYINGIADKLAASLRKVEYECVHPDGNRQAESRSVDTVSVSEAVRARAGKVKISVKEKNQSGESKKASDNNKAVENKNSADAKKSVDTKSNDKIAVVKSGQPKTGATDKTATFSKDKASDRWREDKSSGDKASKK